MPSCDYYKELISAELDGELKQDDRDELNQHLISCNDCRQFAKKINYFHKIIENDKLISLPDARRQMILHETTGSVSNWAWIRHVIIASYKLHRSLVGISLAALLIIIVGVTARFTIFRSHITESQLNDSYLSKPVLKLVLSENDIVANSAIKIVVLTEQDIIETKTVILSDNNM